jgi:hypothetical protein
MCERIAAILQVKEGFRRLYKGLDRKVMKALANGIMAGRHEPIREGDALVPDN